VGLSASLILNDMDYLWTPWRYRYVTGAERKEPQRPRRAGVPAELDALYEGDLGCIFCNLQTAAKQAAEKGYPLDAAERAAYIVKRYEHHFIVLNLYPYSSGHAMIVPYQHTDSLAKLPRAAAQEMMELCQELERAMRAVYHPEGINFGLNLGQAAGAGVQEHIHMHALPRWLGDTSFMTSTAESRVLPEALDITWERLREALR